MNTNTVHSRVFLMRTPSLSSALQRHIRQTSESWVVVIGHQAGEEGLRHLLRAVNARHRRRADTVLFPSDNSPKTAVPMRGLFDNVATGAEFNFLSENNLIDALQSHDSDDRAIGVSYSSGGELITFITGDLKHVNVPTSEIKKHPIMGIPDLSSITLIDGGHTVVFGGDYEVAFDGLRYVHDPEYRKAVRKRARDQDRSFGGCLRRARFHKKLGQSDLGVSDHTIRRIENGETSEQSINDRTRQSIERHLGMTFDEIKSF